MSDVRAALYLDFDNVFSGLYKVDPDVAVRFASEPDGWLRRLSTTLMANAPRRWLILRCYLNPSGWVYHPDPAGEQARLYFSKFRPAFVRAGFEVIDCPRYSGTKNAADIRIVVDAIDALSADTRYDEFVIASGDSDMTPLLQRLRRSDRRTMIVSPADAAAAFTSIADQVLDSQQLLALAQGEPIELDDAEDTLDAEFADGVGQVDVAAVDENATYETFRSLMSAEYAKASEPLNMAALAYRLRAQLGSSVSETATGSASAASPARWQACSYRISVPRSTCSGTAAATRHPSRLRHRHRHRRCPSPSAVWWTSSTCRGCRSPRGRPSTRGCPTTPVLTGST